jgi:hypothetical protein
MKDVFVSGWCGFPELFGDFAEKFDFRVPFYNCEENRLFDNYFAAKNLICWSTGANLALKAESLKFRNIVLVSPFIRFTDYTPERVLKLMIKRFRTAPDAVIKDFLTNCGCPETAMPAIRDYAALDRGLEYLLESGEGVKTKMPRITIVHGTDDAIVPLSAGMEIAKRFGASFAPVKCGHFVPPEIISEYLI